MRTRVLTLNSKHMDDHPPSTAEVAGFQGAIRSPVQLKQIVYTVTWSINNMDSVEQTGDMITKEGKMASKAMHLHNIPPDLGRVVDRLFRVAFEASAAAFLRDSLCGWGPMLSLPDASLLPSASDAYDMELAASESTAGVQIQEAENCIVIKIEVAHFKAESIYLEISDEILIVRGECNADAPLNQDSGWSHRDGLTYERFITLPVPVQPGKIRAKLIGRVIKIEIDTM